MAWLTLDEGDNDAVVLWAHVVEALCRACPGLALRACVQWLPVGVEVGLAAGPAAGPPRRSQAGSSSMP